MAKDYNFEGNSKNNNSGREDYEDASNETSEKSINDNKAGNTEHDSREDNSAANGSLREYTVHVDPHMYSSLEIAAQEIAKYVNTGPYRILKSIPMLQYKIGEDDSKNFVSGLESALEDSKILYYDRTDNNFNIIDEK